MKVSKEAIIGLLVALQRLTEEGFAEKAKQLRLLLENIQAKLEGISGVEMRIIEEYKGGYPMLEVKIDEKVVGKSAAQVCKKLEHDGIYVRVRYLDKGLVAVHSVNMDDEIARIVSERLQYALIS